MGGTGSGPPEPLGFAELLPGFKLSFSSPTVQIALASQLYHWRDFFEAFRKDLTYLSDERGLFMECLS